MAVASRLLGPVTRIGAATVVLGVVCYVVGWRLGWIELMVATAGCLVALAVAVPFIVGPVNLELTRTVEPDRVMVGEPAGAVLSVVNPGKRRTRAIGIDEVIGGTVVPVSVPALAPGGDHTTVYRLPTERRAKVQVGPAVVARTDPLGLLRRQVSQAPATTLWVHPRWAIAAPLPSGFAKDLEGPTSDASPAGDVAFHALRPYRLGDDRRHIHWMSTARTGTLMVRHYVDNRRPTLGVLLDDSLAPYDDEMFEVAVEIATSLLVSSLLHQLPVTGRTTTEWLAGRLRPVGRDSLLEHLTEVERSDRAAGLVEAAAELTRVETSTSALAIVTGGRSAIELLAPVAYLRKRVRVIVIVVDGAVVPDQRVAALPGARVLHAADLEGFRGVEADRVVNVRAPVADERVVTSDANATADVLRWIALTLVAVLSVAGTLGLHSLTGDWSFLVPATIGAIGAAAVVEGSRRFGLLVGESLAVSVVAFVVVGTVVVGIVPTPGALVDFFDGLTRSWADLLSAVTPTDLTPELRVAPFALAWCGTMLGASLLRWVRQPGVPILGPLLVLAITVLLTDEDRAVSLLVGAAIAVGALAIGLLQQWMARTAGRAPDDSRSVVGSTSSSRRGRLVAAGGVLALVAVTAPLLGPKLPLAESRERFDLRDRVVPPWDPLALPSPLVQVKAALAAEREEDVVFEVESETPITRWSLAVMGSFDGVVWTVADPDSADGGAAAEFRPVGTRLPAPAVQPTSDPETTATVRVVGLAGPWLPVPGAVRELRFDNATGATSPIVRENLETGTLAIADGVAPGTTYTVTALLPPERSDEELRELPILETGSDFDLEVLPPQINNLAADITEGIDFGWGQVAAVRDRFTATGFYDKSTNTPPGHSYFRLAQFLADPDEIIGFEEQYAAGAAVVTRIAGLPTRVVAGFEIPADRYTGGVAEVRSGDASAWIEVRVEGVGWVPVSVTPPRSREPDTQTAVTPDQQVATPNPPPPPQVPPDIDVVNENRELEEPVEEEDEEEQEDDASVGGGIGLFGWIGVGVGILVGVLAAFCAIVVAWKYRRMRRRREAAVPSLRIAGAWSEVADRYDEAGVPIARRATPLETARAYIANEPSATVAAPRLLALVGTVDRAAYHADEPGVAESDEAWQYHDDVVRALLDDRSLPQRAQMRLDPRPLFRRDAWQRAQAGDPPSHEATTSVPIADMVDQ